MIGVLVRPPLPVGERHGTEEPVHRLKGVGLGGGEDLETRDSSREILRED
jgi:hypothetical protein